MVNYILKTTEIIFIIGIVQASFGSPVSFKNIFNQIRENEFKAYQTVILRDGETRYLEVQTEILQSTLGANPSRVVNLKSKSAMTLKNSIGSKSYSQITLFIIVLEHFKSNILIALDVIWKILGKYRIPRCLMITFDNEQRLYFALDGIINLFT